MINGKKVLTDEQMSNLLLRNKEFLPCSKRINLKLHLPVSYVTLPTLPLDKPFIQLTTKQVSLFFSDIFEASKLEEKKIIIKQ